LIIDSQDRLFSASKDASIKVWDLTFSREVDNVDPPNLETLNRSSTPSPSESPSIGLLATLNDHQGKIYSLRISDDRYLYSGSGDRTIRVWDTQDAHMPCIGLYEGHADGVNAICFTESSEGYSRSSSHLVSASNDKTVKLWDRTTKQMISSCTLDSEVLDVAYSLDTNLLFASTYDATISGYDLRMPVSSTAVTVLHGHNWEVWQLEVVESCLFSGSFDHTIKRWDLRMFECSATLSGHQGFVHAMTLGCRALITGCADRTIKVCCFSRFFNIFIPMRLV
jgi:WD40 repeat protein